MKSTSNECVGCTDLGIHCIGSSCPNLDVTRYYCDECECEDTLYETEYGELCMDCLIKKFPIIEGSDKWV